MTRKKSTPSWFGLAAKLHDAPGRPQGFGAKLPRVRDAEASTTVNPLGEQLVWTVFFDENSAVAVFASEYADCSRAEI